MQRDKDEIMGMIQRIDEKPSFPRKLKHIWDIILLLTYNI